MLSDVKVAGAWDCVLILMAATDAKCVRAGGRVYGCIAIGYE